MVTTGVVMVVGLMASFPGESGTREEKFRGVLLAQAAEEGRGSAMPLDARSELDALIASRPSLSGAGAALGVGGVLSLVGLPFFFLANMGRELSIGAVVLGFALSGTGILIGMIAAVVMIVQGVRLAKIDARIRELENPRAPAPTARFSLPPTLVLARF